MMSPSSPATSPRPLSEKISEPLAAAAEVQPSIIEGYLTGSRKVVVDETRFQDELRTKGFGEKENAEFILKPYEALYLFYTKRLRLRNKPKNLLQLSAKYKIWARKQSSQ
jgi:hypothetical protein